MKTYIRFTVNIKFRAFGFTFGEVDNVSTDVELTPIPLPFTTNLFSYNNHGVKVTATLVTK